MSSTRARRPVAGAARTSTWTSRGARPSGVLEGWSTQQQDAGRPDARQGARHDEACEVAAGRVTHDAADRRTEQNADVQHAGQDAISKAALPAMHEMGSQSEDPHRGKRKGETDTKE